MNAVYIGLFFAVFGGIMAVVSRNLKEKRGTNEKYQKILGDFYSAVMQMMAPGEELVAYCGYNPCAAITNRRLLIGDKKGIHTIPFSQIRKIRGMNFSGNTTRDPEQMLVLEIKADKKYVIGNHSEGFSQVVKAMDRYVAAR